MNKDKLAQELAVREDISKREARYIVDSVFDIMSEELIKNNVVNIVGFGQFDVRERKSRKGRNPATGEEIILPATRRVAFSASKNLNDAVKGRA